MLIKKIKEPSEQPGQPLPPPPPPPPVQPQVTDQKPALPHQPELRLAKPVPQTPPQAVIPPPAEAGGVSRISPFPVPPGAEAPGVLAKSVTQPRAAAPGEHLPPLPPVMVQTQAAAQGLPPPSPTPAITQPPVLTQPQADTTGQPSPSPTPAVTQPQAVVPIQPLLPPQPILAQNEAPPVAERKIREYRYRTRIIKAAILPIFFSIMSFWMLYNYVNGFEPFFSYEINIILAGFLIGFIVIAGFVLANMRRAKKDGSYAARQKYGVVIIMAFLVPYAYYLLFKDPAEAWKFSIGYFASAIITPFVVMAYEALSDGKFYVQEEEVNDRLTRTLVFRH